MNQQMKDEIINWLENYNNEVERLEFYVDEPMSKHTTFKIGGNVDFLICPKSRTQLEQIYRWQYELQFPIYTIGQGSNILVPDEGINGVIVKLEDFNYEIQENKIISSAGASLVELAKLAYNYGLSGMEFASGIPGSIGGAVFMNAGAYGGNMSDIVKEITVFTKNGSVNKLTNDELDFGYRKCAVQKNGDMILDVTIELEKGEPEKIQAKMLDLEQRRKSKQPLNMPSAGSVFKRPEGYFAGQLIDEAGLRGLSYGDAQVSEKHCGFIVNKGNATANDVIELVSTVQKIVYDKFGVVLERELRILGE